MKKFFTTFLLVAMFAIMLPLTASTASAQSCYTSRGRQYVSNRRNVQVKRPNIYRRHRKAFNIGIGTGIGALVGGLLGGRKGVIIGGLAGAGGGALFTHKQRPKNYTRYVYRRP